MTKPNTPTTIAATVKTPAHTPEQFSIKLWEAASDAASDKSVKWKPKASAAAALVIQSAFDVDRATLAIWHKLGQIEDDVRANQLTLDDVKSLALAALTAATGEA